MKTKDQSVLSTTAKSAIAASYCEALDTVDTTGSLLTQVCETAYKYLRGVAFTKEERADVVELIAKNREWKGKSADSRKSEVNVILKAYAKLPEGLKLFSKKSTRCQWHDGMKIARRVNQGDTIVQAVAFALKKKSGDGNPVGRVAGVLAALLDEYKRGEKREAVKKAMRTLVDAGIVELKGKNAVKFANA